MPAKYDPTKALPLRVPPELREALDALGAKLPEALRLPRNTVAALALARGVAVLGAELERDPLALHRALAALDGPPTSSVPPTAAPRSVDARPSPGASAERAPVTPGGGDAIDSAALLKRWKRSGLPAAPFCKAHGVTRSALQAWVGGRPAKASTLAKIAAGLDAEGK